MGKKRGHEALDNDFENKSKRHRSNGSSQSLDQMISQESSKIRSADNYTQTSPPAVKPSSNPIIQRPNLNKVRSTDNYAQTSPSAVKPSSGPIIQRPSLNKVRSIDNYAQTSPPTFKPSSGPIIQRPSPNGHPFISNLPPPLSTTSTARPTKAKIRSNSLPPLPPLPPIYTTSLQDLPFTHQGILGGVPLSTATTQSYQRLEFLGDAYLELIASRLLYTTFPYWTPGRLSMKREQLVKNETLAGYALRYGFQERAKLPEHLLAVGMGGGGDGREGERGLTGGMERGMSAKERDKAEKSWNKILGDMFEAYVAAVVLDAGDHGFERAETWMRELWMPLVEEDLHPKPQHQHQHQDQNPNQIEITENTEQPPPKLDFPKVELSKRIMGKGIRIDYRHEIDPDTVRRKPTEKGSQAKFIIGAYLTGWGWKMCVWGAGRGLVKWRLGTWLLCRRLGIRLRRRWRGLRRRIWRRLGRRKRLRRRWRGGSWNWRVEEGPGCLLDCFGGWN